MSYRLKFKVYFFGKCLFSGDPEIERQRAAARRSREEASSQRREMERFRGYVGFYLPLIYASTGYTFKRKNALDIQRKTLQHSNTPAA